MARLGVYFDSREFACKDGTPAPASSHPELRDLCRKYLDPMRRRFGPATVHSGYRTAGHNRSVGGAVESFHRYDLSGRYGVAADVTFRTGSPSQWAAAAEQLQAGGVGRYATFVHVDNRRGRARWTG